MKFGKLPGIEGVDFSLPPLNERSLALLGGQAHDHFEMFVGLSRWASKEWVGHLYPKGTKQVDYLAHYSKAYNTIELNSTHYRSPSIDQVKKWRDMAAPGFRFCPKIPQSISHYRKLMNISEELTLFVDAIAHFEESLGCSFVQLHDSFSPALFTNLAHFLAQWPTGFPLAVEFRHPDWFADRQLIPAACDLLEKHGIASVITDVAGRRDVSHSSLTSKIAMIRFVGNELHPTDFSRSQAWLERIALWRQQGLESLYLFPHEPGDMMASDLADFWIKEVNKQFGQRIAGSSGAAAGGQMALF
ncbi:MAG: DUF72 domain-containing protein [Bacteroidia bacterium]|nr:DUF72 domain-containing protein [Bacteroidia bacterium]